MPDPVVSALVLAGLVDVATLYARVMSRRVHQRRIDERIAASARLYGLIRVTLADRRVAA